MNINIVPLDLGKTALNYAFKRVTATCRWQNAKLRAISIGNPNYERLGGQIPRTTALFVSRSQCLRQFQKFQQSLQRLIDIFDVISRRAPGARLVIAQVCREFLVARVGARNCEIQNSDLWL